MSDNHSDPPPPSDPPPSSNPPPQQPTSLTQTEISEGRARFMQALLNMGLAPPHRASSMSPQLPNFNINNPEEPSRLPEGFQQSPGISVEFFFEGGPDDLMDSEGSEGGESDMLHMANMMFGPAWGGSPSPNQQPSPQTTATTDSNPTSTSTFSSTASHTPNSTGPNAQPARPQPSRLPSFGGMFSFFGPPSGRAGETVNRSNEIPPLPSAPASTAGRRDPLPSFGFIAPMFFGGAPGSAPQFPRSPGDTAGQNATASASGLEPTLPPQIPDALLRAFGMPSSMSPSPSPTPGEAREGSSTPQPIHPIPPSMQPLFASMLQAFGSPAASPQPQPPASLNDPPATEQAGNNSSPATQDQTPMPPNLSALLGRLFSVLPLPPPPSSMDASDPNSQPPGRMQPGFIITLSFGGMPPMEDKPPDPARAAELANALHKPSRALLKRLDRATRLEEEADGITEAERQGAKCAVCMESLLDEDEGDVCSLPCSHAYHEPCLLPWLSTHTNCPSCRFDLDPLSTTLRTNHLNPAAAHRRRGAFGTRTPTTAAPSTQPLSQTSTGARTHHPYSRSGSRTSTPTSSRPGTPSGLNPATASNPIDRAVAPTPGSTGPPASASASASTPGLTTTSSVEPPPSTYVAPPARLTLIDHVLALEKRHQLRCSLPLCACAPCEEEPLPPKKPMTYLSKLEGEGFLLKGCAHIFHPECLRLEVGVEGGRVEVRTEEGKVEVACPMRGCKGFGCVSKQEWKAASDGTEEMLVEQASM